jgi:hypothetical protein
MFTFKTKDNKDFPESRYSCLKFFLKLSLIFIATQVNAIRFTLRGRFIVDLTCACGNHTRECHIHTPTCQTYSLLCGSHTLRVGINLVRVEITLVHVEITLVLVEITMGVEITLCVSKLNSSVYKSHSNLLSCV